MTNPTLSREVADRLVAAVQSADAHLNTDAFLALLSEQVIFRIGSAPEVLGREAVRRAVATLFASMKSITHKTIQLTVDGDKIFLQASVQFDPKQGASATLPYVNVLTVGEAELITDYRIHIDLSPLFRGDGDSR